MLLDTVKESSDNQGQSETENESKFMHSSNSPFKVMSSCAYKQSENQDTNPGPSHIISNRPVLAEISPPEPQQRSSCQWQQAVGCFPAHNGRNCPMVQLVDQAVSPIPPSKLVPRASIAIQASLIKDISPLKPLVYVRHRIPSPWKPPAASPSNIPPAPPSTPELPNEACAGPFQSQSNRMFLRNVSPYPTSQSCGSSPVGLFGGAKLFFPPSPNAAANGMVLPHGNLLYGVNQVSPLTISPTVSNQQSNSCPPSVNPSPVPLDAGLHYSPGVIAQRSQPPSPSVSMASQTPQPFTQLSFFTPEVPTFTPCQFQQPPGGKRPYMLMNTGGLDETPTNTVDATGNESVSRKLCLTNETKTRFEA